MGYCAFCKKSLQVGSRVSQQYCKDVDGQPRCRDLARSARLKARAEPSLDLNTLHRRSPRQAVGFRIRLERPGGLWVGPRPGQRNHADAIGKINPSDYYLIGELPRVPLSAEYHVDYVDKHGHILIEPENAPTIQLVRTGGRARYQPGPSLRAKQRCIDAGVPLPPQRRRICDLARELSLLSMDLLAQLSRLGFTHSSVQNSLEPEEVQEVLRRYAERLLPTRGKARAPLPAKREAIGQVTSTSVAVAAAQLDELLPIPLLIQPEHCQALAEVQSVARAVDEVEGSALREAARLESEVDAIGLAVDEASGITSDRGPSRVKGPAVKGSEPQM